MLNSEFPSEFPVAVGLLLLLLLLVVLLVLLVSLLVLSSGPAVFAHEVTSAKDRAAFEDEHTLTDCLVVMQHPHEKPKLSALQLFTVVLAVEIVAQVLPRQTSAPL